MSDSRVRAVAAAILAHQPEPEDLSDEAVKAARDAAAEKQAEQFVAMLDAANADQEAAGDTVDEPAPEPQSEPEAAAEPAPDPKEES